MGLDLCVGSEAVSTYSTHDWLDSIISAFSYNRTALEAYPGTYIALNVPYTYLSTYVVEYIDS